MQKLENLGVDEHTIKVKVDEMQALQSNTAGVCLGEIFMLCAGVSQTRVSPSMYYSSFHSLYHYPKMASNNGKEHGNY